MKKAFDNVWLVLVKFIAKDAYKLKDLIEVDSKSNQIYKGAWANLLVKASSINEALEIIPLGLAELNFEVHQIDKIENVASLIKHKELNEEVLKEIKWLKASKFVFKISDKVFPYK